VREAIESCLSQTYPNIEIIVVDDGSTDRSLEVLRRFLPKIRLETAPHRGGNSARNRGFALSTGEYIQYLDADDYLEPDKISQQVSFLEETKADAVYGDWRCRRHLPGTSLDYLDKVEFTGLQRDIVASLLSLRGGYSGLQPWWLNGGALLYRRQAVNQVGGWDETLRAAQDMDFITSVALSGAKIGYQSGCYFVHRKYGTVSVSSSNLSRWVESYCTSLSKSKLALARTAQLTQEYRSALAVGYFEVARNCYRYDAPASFATYAKAFDRLVNEIVDLCPLFNVKGETRAFMLLQWLFGFKFAMSLLFRIRAAIRCAKSRLRGSFLLGDMLRIRREKSFRRESMRATF
jgi:glycosyltransferase involved in cell wall biosynthesis